VGGDLDEEQVDVVSFKGDDEDALLEFKRHLCL
jgi:hypothetical protein